MRKLLILLLLTLSAQLFAQNVQQKIDALISAYAMQHKLNGTVLVAEHGNIIYQKGINYRNADTKVLNDVNTVFQIGSITKQFTAAIIMQLQEEGKLSVHDKLSKYYPGFVNGDKITIQHLLTHTSGLYNYTNDTVITKRDVTRHYSREEMIAIFQKYPSDFEPGTKWNYSNSGYSMLGYIIEKVTGKPYEQVVHERIFQPLGMTHSGFDFTDLKDPNKAKGYFALYPKVVPAPIVDSTIAFSAGALYTTVGDLYKWEHAITEGKILKPDSWKEVFTPYMHNYGYGWTIDTMFHRNFTAHSGGIHGFTSYELRFPKEEVAVILMDNSSSPVLDKIAKDLAAIVFNEPYEIPQQSTETKVGASTLKQYEGEYELAPTSASRFGWKVTN